MLNLKEIMIADLDEVFFDEDNGFAEPAKYNGINITVIPDIGEGESRKQFDNRYETAFFTVKASDVPNPQVGDVLEHNNIEWQMVGAVRIGSVRHKLKFTTNESAVILR
jgi:starvation-inducible outer membrane lipoprotein